MAKSLKLILSFIFILQLHLLFGNEIDEIVVESEDVNAIESNLKIRDEIQFSDELGMNRNVNSSFSFAQAFCSETKYNGFVYVNSQFPALDFLNPTRFQGDNDKAKREEKLKKMNKWMTGSVGISFSTYHQQSTQANERKTLDPFNYRFFANVTLKVSDKFSLPFSISFSKRQFNTIIPQIPDQKPWDYIRDPRNNFGFHPKLKWGQFHIGTHTPRYSELSTGNIPIFGLGFDFTPGIFKVAASYGYANIAVNHDSINNVRGQYLRTIFATQIGLQGEKWHTLINLVKTDDKVNSIEEDFTRAKPEENFVLSTDIKFTLFNHLTFQTEIAAAAFTANKQDDVLTLGGDAPELPSWLIGLTQSSRMDISGLASLSVQYPKFGISLDGKRMGSGYKSLAYPYFQTDYMDFSGTVRFGLLKNKVNVNGTAGYRLDNLSNTKVATSYRIIYNGNVVAMPIEGLTIGFNFANFGEHNNIEDDTLKVNYVSLNIGSNASYSFTTGSLKNVVSIAYSRSNYKDLNTISGGLNNNRTNNYSVVFSTSVKSIRATVAFTQTLNQQEIGLVKVATLSGSVNYKFEQPKMNVGMRFTYSNNTIFGYSADHQFVLAPSLGWEVAKLTKFNFSGNFRFSKYGERRDYGSKIEQRVVMTMIQNF